MADNKVLYRIKVVLAERGQSNKWLADKLGKGQAAMSKWCKNTAQASLENLIEIAKCVEVDVNERIRKG